VAYKIAKTKEESLEQLKVLISAFEKEYVVYKSQKYSEAQLRIDFLNPLLKTFGWDVDNEETKSQFLRDVIQEESIDIEEEDSITKKNPDYTLRIQGIRKIFVEAKKVSINIEKANKPAFQTRRYGWNAKLGISILTNFELLAVYDCQFQPKAEDVSSIARYKAFHYSDFISKFDELYQLLSFQPVSLGYIDKYFTGTQKDAKTFDDYFLEQIENWRKSKEELILFTMLFSIFERAYLSITPPLRYTFIVHKLSQYVIPGSTFYARHRFIIRECVRKRIITWARNIYIPIIKCILLQIIFITLNINGIIMIHLN
jgi:hypothetical protein